LGLKHFRGLQAAYDNGCFVIVAGQGRGCWLKFQGNFTVGDFNHLANESGFVIDMAWRDQTWGMQMLIPFKEAYIRCWHATDDFFRNLPDWSMKLIDDWHPFCFY
jgi:hypothetical protein